MATKPTIMPLTAPRKVGFFSLPRNMSNNTQVSSAETVARFVLTTAVDASALAKYGSPPLNPFQPSHTMPAPIETSGRLCGRKRCPVAGQSRADHPGGDEPAGASGEVDDVTAGVVDRALVRPVAAAPDQHRVDGVDERRPERDEDHPDLDLDAAKHATQEQQRRDRGEHELEVEQRRRRLGQRQRRPDRQRRLR